jgi:hypothetical protein
MRFVSLPRPPLLFALAAAGAALLAPSVSSAQAPAVSAADRALAEGLFTHGQTLLAAKSYEEACPKLAESHRLDPQLGTLLYLASCHEAQGRVATAWSEFEEAKGWAERARRTDRVKAAAAHLEALAPKVPRLLLEAPPEVTDLTLDGRPLGTSVRGTPLPIDPGEHVVVASAAGRSARTARFVARSDGAITTVTIPALDHLEPGSAPPPPPPAAAPAVAVPPSSPAPSSDQPAPARAERWPVWLGPTVAGVGVAGISVGAVFGLVALGDKNKADACAPAPKPCADRAAVDADHAAHREATIATVSFAAGGVLTAAGIYLILTRRPSAPSVALTPFGAGARLTGTF